MYEKTIDYLKKYYDFNNSIFEIFLNFSSKNKIIVYDNTIKSVNLFGLKHIEKDRLYDKIK